MRQPENALSVFRLPQRITAPSHPSDNKKEPDYVHTPRFYEIVRPVHRIRRAAAVASLRQKRRHALLVAHGKGLLEQHGVAAAKPVLFRSWAGLVEAFLSGQVNLIHVLSPMSVWMRYGSRAPVRALMWNHICGSALTVRPDVNTLADLQGQTVAIPFWYSIHNIIVQQMLRQAGLAVVEQTRRRGRCGSP